jgi:hypothetical protein
MSYELLFDEFDQDNSESRFRVSDIGDAETIASIESVFSDWYYENVDGGYIMDPEDNDGGKILAGISEDGLDRVLDGFNDALVKYNGQVVTAYFC